MKYLLTAFMSLLFFAGFSQEREVRLKHFNLEKGVALEGYDPVSYFKGVPAEGKREYAITHNGVIYYFATTSNRTAFISDPGRYEPAYGGWCAYAMGKSGEKVRIDPETYKLIDGKLYLFYNFWGSNTLEDWNANELQLKSSADNQWKKYANP